MKLTNFALATSGVYLVANSSMVSSRITAARCDVREWNRQVILLLALMSLLSSYRLQHKLAGHTLGNEVDLVVGHGVGGVGGRLSRPGRELAHIGGVALHRGGHRKKAWEIRKRHLGDQKATALSCCHGQD